MLDAEKAEVSLLQKLLETATEKCRRAEALEKKVRRELVSPFIVSSLIDAFIAISGVESIREKGEQGSS